MSKAAADSVMRGLEEALAYTEGRTEGARIHEVEVPEVDVARIRARTGLSQAQFARSIGVARGTLLNWEQGPAASYRSRPGTAGADRPPTLRGRGTTALIERPEIVSRMSRLTPDPGQGLWTDGVLAACRAGRPATDP